MRRGTAIAVWATKAGVEMGRHCPMVRLASACTAMVVVLAISATTTAAEGRAWEFVVCADPNASPFSNRDETGFENRIAHVLADEMGAVLEFFWIPQVRTQMTQALREGRCDVIIGLADGGGGVLATIAYYRSPYVFVYRSDEDYEIATFDDPILRDLRIGVQPIESPAHQALLRRDLRDNITMETQVFLGGPGDPLEPMIAAVAGKQIDVLVTWGPAAGYYADRQPVSLTVTAAPPFEPPIIQMFINMVAGVRLGDDSLRDRLDIAIVNRWGDIQSVLDDANIPRMPLAPPVLTIETP